MSDTAGSESILGEVSRYYSSKLDEHGATPQGVDWNGEESQFLRFEQLTRIVPRGARFSLNDIGCGFGSLIDFLDERYEGFEYRGYDISPEMVDAAAARYPGRNDLRFSTAESPWPVADFSVASGIFNVRQGRGADEWSEYILVTLDAIDAASSKGFAFNCLTSYSDADRVRDYLHYSDPLALFDHCKRHYAKDVALLHDYGLYEFTILVRKELS
jgi:SAM-dependent methyltransferase